MRRRRSGIALALALLLDAPAALAAPADSFPEHEGFRSRSHAAEHGCGIEELDGRRGSSCVLVESGEGADVLRIYDARPDGRFEYADWICAAPGSWSLVDVMGTGRKALVAILDLRPGAGREKSKVMAAVVLGETGPHAIFAEPLELVRDGPRGCATELHADVRVEARASESVLLVGSTYRDCKGAPLRWEEALPWDRGSASFYAHDEQRERAEHAAEPLQRRLASCRMRVPFADAHDLCGTFPGDVGLTDLLDG